METERIMELLEQITRSQDEIQVKLDNLEDDIARLSANLDDR